MSIPSSIPDTALGLTSSEVLILRQQQQLAAQQHQAQTASRGRGHSRTSQPSSRAASAASSNQGRIFLDTPSLSRLNAQLETLMHRIQDRIDVLDDMTRRSVEASSSRAGSAMQDADDQIARVRKILAEIDSLEGNLDNVKRVRDVVKQLRARADDMDRRLDRASSGHAHAHSHSHNHGARPLPRR